MTKLTKNEKILRKANEKWKNFLAEGAFKKTLKEFDEDDAYHFDQDKSDSEPLPPEAKSATFWVEKGDKVRIYGQASKKGPQPPEEYKCKYGIVKGFSKENDREVIVQFDDGKVLSLDHSVMSKNPGTWKMDFFYPDCEDDISEGGTMGEYGQTDAEDGNPPSKIGRGNEEYMAAYNAVLQARGEEPLDIQKPDQAYLDALRSGQLQEAVNKRARQLLSEGLTPEQVKEKILEEGLGDFIRKGADFVKAKTGLGRTTKTRELYNKMKFEKDKYFEFRDKFYPDANDVRNFMEFVEQNARKQGGGRGGMMSDLAYKAISREKFKTMDSPITYLKQARKLANNIEKMMLDGAVDQKGDKTFKVIRSMAESIMKDFEQARAYLKELRVAIKRAQKSGDAQALKDIYKDQVEHERYLSQSQARADKAFAAKAKEAERKARKDKPKDDEDMIRGKSTERFGLATNLEENEKKKFKVGEFVRIVAGSLKGATGKVIELVTTTEGEQGYVIELYSSAKMKVFGGPGDEVIATADEMESGGTTDGMELYDIDERSKDDERDLEKPVKYGSGAELEFDKKAQKFYDRKRDMYIDDPEEEDNLIKEKDEKEFAKIFARAKDMLVLSARSRVPVTLKSVQSALDVIKVPSEMEKGKLIVKNEYVIADKNELPESAKQISFTKYAMDYLSNLEGEQLDLPME